MKRQKVVAKKVDAVFSCVQAWRAVFSVTNRTSVSKDTVGSCKVDVSTSRGDRSRVHWRLQMSPTLDVSTRRVGDIHILGPTDPEPIKHEGHRPPKESMVPPGTVNAKVDRHAHAKTDVSNKTKAVSTETSNREDTGERTVGNLARTQGRDAAAKDENSKQPPPSEPNKRVVVKNKRNKMTIITITRQIDLLPVMVPRAQHPIDSTHCD